MKLLLCYDSEDAQIISSYAAPLLQNHKVAAVSEVSSAAELAFLALKHGIDAVLLAGIQQTELFIDHRYSHFPSKDRPAVDSLSGSFITAANGKLHYLILPPAPRLVDSNYGKFLWKHYLTKLTAPETWYKPAPFEFSVYGRCSKSAAQIVEELSTARLIAIDIETVKEDLRIVCVAYCGMFYSTESHTWSHKTYVVPFNDLNDLALIRQLNLLPAPKIFQNGKYDCSYFLRWGAPVVNWLWDTQTLFHAWYSELPKRLDFLTAFALRDVEYWKHESTTGSLDDLHRYNAKDAWATGFVLLSLLKSAPAWALENYKQEFPLNMPSLWAEMYGIKCDMERLEIVQAEREKASEDNLARIRAMLGIPFFNPRSPKHMLFLFKVLGAPHVKSAAEKHLIKVKRIGPLHALIIERIQAWKKNAKLLSTYLVPEKFLGGRILYAINPHGTDTGRQASKEHHFWCGLQIQNIPRGDSVKQLFIADDGWHLGEADGEQAEARYVAYLSGDKNLIATVESGLDYHSVNAERFFGVPYNQIISPEGKVLLKDLRDLSKRINHGTNYNMGAGTLLETMGIDKVLEAKRLLNLPARLSALDVCKHLLDLYDQAYPLVKTLWYSHIKAEIRLTKQLKGATGWTRYCFGNPDTNKPDLNSYVAHVPQSLSAMVLNKGFMRVFEQIQLQHPEHFRLHAQIHDSILFSYRIGYEHLAEQVRELMQISVDIKGADGVVRKMTVPVALKLGKQRWSELS